MKNLSIAGRRVPPPQSYSIGTQIGWWVVIENHLQKQQGGRMRPACRVRCRCGTEAVREDHVLRQGVSTRCKRCAWTETHKRQHAKQRAESPIIPVGTKFGYWTVIETGFFIGTARGVRVRCECGVEKDKTYAPLRLESSTSCGCRRWTRSVEGTWEAIYRNTARRGRECHLTLLQVKEICRLNCAYCGIEPSNVMRPKLPQRKHESSLAVRYSGIDRIDSSLGYVEGNVVPCCARCNAAKSDMSVEEFLAMLSRIRTHNPTVAGIHELAKRLAP